MEYYNYGDFQFDLEQMKWALYNAEFFRDGMWPPEYKRSGYVESPTLNINAEASFVRAKVIWGEIDIRLAKCGRDRYLVEKNYCEGLPEDTIAREVGMDLWSVHKRINAVMSYISSGECPRWLDCEVCGQHEQCHKKKKGRKAKSYTDWLSHYIRR